jgi:glycosyltransferase involved in cell wall biosynthesis
LSEKIVLERALQSPLRILFLGNLIERKGFHALLEAVSDERLTVKVDVVGALDSEPAYARAMQASAAARGFRSAVTFHGPLDHAPLVEKLKAAHVLVVPSSYEGFGIVYLEGMGFGLPAIGTTAGAAGEIIVDGKNGYLISPRDSRTLTDRLIALDRDRALLRQLSLNALTRYRQQPKWEETAARIRKFLLAQIEKWKVGNGE